MKDSFKKLFLKKITPPPLEPRPPPVPRFKHNSPKSLSSPISTEIQLNTRGGFF